MGHAFELTFAISMAPTSRNEGHGFLRQAVDDKVSTSA